MSDEPQPEKKSIVKSFLIPGKVFWGILAFSLLVSYLFNVYIFRSNETWSLTLTGWISSAALTTLVLMLSLKIKWLGYILLPLVVLMSGAVWYVHEVFGTYVNYEVIASICETHWEEAEMYCTWDKVIGVILLLALTIGGIWLGNKKLNRCLAWKDFILPVLIYAVSTPIFFACWYGMDSAGPDFVAYKEAATWPVGDLGTNYKRIRKYKKHGEAHMNMLSQLPSMADAESSCSLDPEEEITIVFHMGESVRADHFQINGYERETTPNLMKRRDQIVSFKSCHSFGLFTRISVIGLLTDAEMSARKPKYSSFINLFNRHGYDTGTVLYSPASLDDVPLSVLTRQAQTRLFVPRGAKNEGDPTLEPTIRQVDNLDKQMGGKRKLIFIYDNGAHWAYTSHPMHKKFLPDNYKKDSPSDSLPEVINAYDNNLLEIDWEFGEIMKRLEKKNAVFIYVSDHGDALGEDGRFGHGFFAEPVKKPAFFIWMSDSFREKHSDMFSNLKKYENMPVSHDYILHTLLSLGGLRFSGYKPELDLTGAEAKSFDHPPTDEKMMQE